MGINIFGSSSTLDESKPGFSSSSIESGVTSNLVQTGNPRPDRFNILQSCQVGDYSIIRLVYPDCNNYEGEKLLVFKCKLQDILDQGLIDPHFSDNTKYIHPIARFKPVENCFWTAIEYVDFLIMKDLQR